MILVFWTHGQHAIIGKNEVAKRGKVVQVCREGLASRSRDFGQEVIETQ